MNSVQSIVENEKFSEQRQKIWRKKKQALASNVTVPSIMNLRIKKQEMGNT